MTDIASDRPGRSADGAVDPGGSEPAEPAPGQPLASQPPSSVQGVRASLWAAARLAAPAIGLYLVLRVVSLEVTALLANAARDRDPGRQVFWDGSHDKWRGFSSMLDALLAWDGRWYVLLADEGVRGPMGAVDANGVPYHLRVMFSPLYPWLARPLTVLPFISPVTACLIVSFGSAVAAAWGLFVIGRRLRDDRFGVLLAGLWAVVPAAFTENGAFTESLFTALSAWALYAVLTERWLVAGLLASLSGLTRPSAAALIGTVGLAALVAAVNRRGGWRPYGAMLLAPAGYVGYLAYAAHQVGGLSQYFDIHRSTFGAYFDYGVSTWDVVRGIMIGVGDDAGTPVRTMSVFYLVGFIMLAILVAVDRSTPWVLVVFTAAMFVVNVGSHNHISMLERHLLPVFPVLFVPALLLARASVRTTAIVLGTLALLSGWYGGWLPFISGQAI